MFAICAFVAMFLCFQLAEAELKGLVMGGAIEVLNAQPLTGATWKKFRNEPLVAPGLRSIDGMCKLQTNAKQIVALMEKGYLSNGAGTYLAAQQAATWNKDNKESGTTKAILIRNIKSGTAIQAWQEGGLFAKLFKDKPVTLAVRASDAAIEVFQASGPGLDMTVASPPGGAAGPIKFYASFLIVDESKMKFETEGTLDKEAVLSAIVGASENPDDMTACADVESLVEVLSHASIDRTSHPKVGLVMGSARTFLQSESTITLESWREFLGKSEDGPDGMLRPLGSMYKLDATPNEIIKKMKSGELCGGQGAWARRREKEVKSGEKVVLVNNIAKGSEIAAWHNGGDFAETPTETVHFALDFDTAGAVSEGPEQDGEKTELTTGSKPSPDKPIKFHSFFLVVDQHKVRFEDEVDDRPITPAKVLQRIMEARVSDPDLNEMPPSLLEVLSHTSIDGDGQVKVHAPTTDNKKQSDSATHATIDGQGQVKGHAPTTDTEEQSQTATSKWTSAASKFRCESGVSGEGATSPDPV